MSDLTPEDVREILRAIDEAGYDEFELETPRFTLRLNRRADPGEVRDESTQSRGLGGPNPGDDESTRTHAVVDVTSPMVGTLYRSPAPGTSPFVEVGSRVEVGAQLCIIEVMKLMNAVTSSTAGTVAEVCVENGAAVQYGDVLFRIRADA
jgi:acetyl-CoA carboxylase biotin carboxyl carrier protein